MKKSIKILWMVPFLITIILFFAMQKDYKNMKSMSSHVYGTITNLEIEARKNSKNEDYNIQYEFFVNNEKYTGKDYENNTFHYLGESIIVNYNPQNPNNNCMMLREKPFSSLIAVGISIIFIIAVCAYVEGKVFNKKLKNIEEEFNLEKKFTKTFLMVCLVTLTIFILFIVLNLRKIIEEKLFSWVLIPFCYIMPSIICIIFGFKRYIVLNFIDKNPKIKKIMDKCEVKIKCQNSEVFFNDEFLIESGYQLIIIKYTDIVSASIKEISTTDGGSSCVLIKTKDNGKISIANGAFINLEQQNAVLEEIKKRMPNTFVKDSEEKTEIKKGKKNIGGAIGIIILNVMAVFALLDMYNKFLSIPKSNRVYTKAKIEEVSIRDNGESTDIEYEVSYNIGNKTYVSKIKDSLYFKKLKKGTYIDIYYNKNRPKECRIISNLNYITITASLIFSLGILGFEIHYLNENIHEKRKLIKTEDVSK